MPVRVLSLLCAYATPLLVVNSIAATHDKTITADVTVTGANSGEDITILPMIRHSKKLDKLMH